MEQESVLHDTTYKEFFSNPDMLKSLLLDFVPENFIKNFDFNTLELCNTSYGTPDLSQRHGDIVWRVRWQDAWCYIYILLEFQSSPDYWMPLRIAVYTGLLWQTLIKTRQIKQGDKLPPVLPIVIYNGENAWNAPINLKDLIAPIHADLNKYQLDQAYFLIDENRLTQILIDNAKGESGYIFRLERAANAEEIMQIYQEFMSRVSDEKFGFLRRSIRIWLMKMLRKRKFIRHNEKNVADEDNIMLEQKFRRWEQEFIEKGILIGEEKGFAKGQAVGLASGLGIQKSTLLEMLGDRFGPVPVSWQEKITNIKNATIISELTKAVWKVGSPEEFDVLLHIHEKNNLL